VDQKGAAVLEVREPEPEVPVAPDPPASRPSRRRRQMLVAIGVGLVVLLVAASVAAITWKASSGHSTDRVTASGPSPAIATDPAQPAEVPTTVVPPSPSAAPVAAGPAAAAAPRAAATPQQQRSAPACTLATGYPLTIPEAMSTGLDGALWFTQPGVGRIGRLSLAGAYSSFAVTGVPGDQNGIAAGSDGALWFSETNRIGRMTTTGDIKNYPLPNGIRPGRLVAGADGALWFVETNRSAIGHVSTRGDFTEIALPGDQPAKGIVAAYDKTIWVARGDLFRLSPAGEATEYHIAQFAQDNVHPEVATGGVVVGRDGAIWFITKYALHRMTFDGHDAIVAGGPDVVTPTPGPPQTDLAVDGNGDFWISTIAGGGSQGSVQRAPGQSPQNIEPAKGYPGDVPAALATGPDGAAWVGTSPATTKGAPYGPSSILRLTKNGTTVVKTLPCPT
jgi:virginiamycin B lyase